MHYKMKKNIVIGYKKDSRNMNSKGCTESRAQGTSCEIDVITSVFYIWVVFFFIIKEMKYISFMVCQR